MPKRSRFEAMPQGYLNHARLWDDRTLRRVRQTYHKAASMIGVDWGELRLYMIRSFGFNDIGVPPHPEYPPERLGLYDRWAFANLTGRLAYLQRAFREVLDRRRRQAYLLLRRVLPMELAGPIVLNYS
jgi:hypothetical protein